MNRPPGATSVARTSGSLCNWWLTRRPRLGLGLVLRGRDRQRRPITSTAAPPRLRSVHRRPRHRRCSRSPAEGRRRLERDARQDGGMDDRGGRRARPDARRQPSPWTSLEALVRAARRRDDDAPAPFAAPAKARECSRVTAHAFVGRCRARRAAAAARAAPRSRMSRAGDAVCGAEIRARTPARPRSPARRPTPPVGGLNAARFEARSAPSLRQLEARHDLTPRRRLPDGARRPAPRRASSTPPAPARARLRRLARARQVPRRPGRPRPPLR